MKFFKSINILFRLQKILDKNIKIINKKNQQKMEKNHSFLCQNDNDISENKTFKQFTTNSTVVTNFHR